MDDTCQELPTPIGINEALALDFLTAAAELLEDPNTPETLRDVIVAVLDSQADIFIKLVCPE